MFTSHSCVLQYSRWMLPTAVVSTLPSSRFHVPVPCTPPSIASVSLAASSTSHLTLCSEWVLQRITVTLPYLTSYVNISSLFHLVTCLIALHLSCQITVSVTNVSCTIAPGPGRYHSLYNRAYVFCECLVKCKEEAPHTATYIASMIVPNIQLTISGPSSNIADHCLRSPCICYNGLSHSWTALSSRHRFVCLTYRGQQLLIA